MCVVWFEHGELGEASVVTVAIRTCCMLGIGRRLNDADRRNQRCCEACLLRKGGELSQNQDLSQKCLAEATETRSRRS